MATMHGGSNRLPFKIFHTDYESYDIHYHCEDVAGGYFKNEEFSVATRDVKPSKETMDVIKKVVAEKLP